MKKLILAAIGLVGIAVLLVGMRDAQATVLPVAGQTYNLAGSGLSSSATSITLTSFTIKQTGQPIQDADMSSTFYLTIEPGSNSKQEIVSCTTVPPNTGGSITLTGCVRGLSPIYPYTASTTLAFTHGGGTQVIISDPPQLFNQYAAKENNETITGQWTFSTFPITPSNGTSTINRAGVVQLATPAQTAAGTATSTNGTVAPLTIANNTATSTWNSQTAGNVVPVTGLSTKRIDPSFLFGQATTFPTTQGASSTVLMTDGSGNMTFNGVSTLLSASSTSGMTVVGAASTTFYTATLPAGWLGQSNAVRVSLYLSQMQGVGDINYFSFGFGGTATTSIQVISPTPAVNTLPYILTFLIKATGTNTQKLAVTAAAATTTPLVVTNGTVDTSLANQITITARNLAADTGTLTSFALTEVLRQ